MDWVVSMLGAIALLIWGLRTIRTAAERIFSSEIGQLSGYINQSKWRAAGVGVLGGLALQSGTAAAVLAANFAERQRLAFSIAVSVILGADLGSAVAAFVLSANVASFSPVLVFTGVVIFLLSNERRTRNFGRGLLGLGLVFLALALIRDHALALRSSEIASEILTVIEQDLALAFFLGMILTLLSFSSIAVVLTLVQLLGGGVIGFEAAVFLLIGANAGAGALPVLACMDLRRRGARSVEANLYIRSGMAAILAVVLTLIPSFDVEIFHGGLALLAVHVGFNGFLVVCGVSLSTRLSAVTERLRPYPPANPSDHSIPHAVYLEENDLERPERALANCTRELLRSADTIHDMLSRTMDSFTDASLVSQIRERDEVVDVLHKDIADYITRIMRQKISEPQAWRARALFDFSTNLEHIGDIIDHNLMELARSKKRMGVEFSEEGWKELCKLHSTLVTNFSLALDVVMNEDISAAEELLDKKRQFRKKALKSQSKHFHRLLDGHTDSVDSLALHIDILRDMRRVNSHITTPAYLVLEGGRV